LVTARDTTVVDSCHTKRHDARRDARLTDALSCTADAWPLRQYQQIADGTVHQREGNQSMTPGGADGGWVVTNAVFDV
jgi:hypothetical protein